MRPFFVWYSIKKSLVESSNQPLLQLIPILVFEM